MARTDTLGHFLTDVADAIRTKTGSSETIIASDFDTEIENIPSGGSSHDWSAIGYNGEPKSLQEMFDCSKEIYDNWDNTIIDLKYKFNGDKKLIWFPLVDTSNVTNMSSMFLNCTSLKEIPQFDTSNVTNMSSMFHNCTILTTVPALDTSSIRNNGFNNMFSDTTKLTDESLNNILTMCINATSYNGTKTLAIMGFQSRNYSASRIEALSNYQSFINAGWTIGY